MKWKTNFHFRWQNYTESWISIIFFATLLHSVYLFLFRFTFIKVFISRKDIPLAIIIYRARKIFYLEKNSDFFLFVLTSNNHVLERTECHCQFQMNAMKCINCSIGGILYQMFAQWQEHTRITNRKAKETETKTTTNM